MLQRLHDGDLLLDLLAHLTLPDLRLVHHLQRHTLTRLTVHRQLHLSERPVTQLPTQHVLAHTGGTAGTGGASSGGGLGGGGGGGGGDDAVEAGGGREAVVERLGVGGDEAALGAVELDVLLVDGAERDGAGEGAGGEAGRVGDGAAHLGGAAGAHRQLLGNHAGHDGRHDGRRKRGEDEGEKVQGIGEGRARVRLQISWCPCVGAGYGEEPLDTW